jgi:hypothetical protein
MTEYRTVLERAGSNAPQPNLELERILRRRDRKRRNQRFAAGVVGVAVFVAALGIVTSVGPLNRSETTGVPGGDVTEPVQIGTVTRSEAGCALEVVAEPIRAGAGRLSLVNEMKRWVSFELLRFDPEVLTFAQLEAMVATGKYRGGTFTFAPAGVFYYARQGVGPGASGIITDNFTTGDPFAVVCLDRRSFDPGFAVSQAPENFALVGPIVVP